MKWFVLYIVPSDSDPPAINHGAIINGMQGRNIILRGGQKLDQIYLLIHDHRTERTVDVIHCVE